MTSSLLAVAVHSETRTQARRRQRKRASQARLVERLSSVDNRLPLFAKKANRKTRAVDVSPLATGADLLAVHSAEKEISTSQGELRKSTPQDEATTPSTAGDREQGKLHLFVRTTDGEAHAVDVDPLATGADLQSVAAPFLGSAALQGIFSFGGQALPLDQSLADSSVSAESIVDFIPPRLWNLQELDEQKPIFEAEVVVTTPTGVVHSLTMFLKYWDYGPVGANNDGLGGEHVHYFFLVDPNPPGHVDGPGFQEIPLFESTCIEGINFMPVQYLTKRDDGTGSSRSHIATNDEIFPFDVAFCPASYAVRLHGELGLNIDYTVTFKRVVYVEGEVVE